MSGAIRGRIAGRAAPVLTAMLLLKRKQAWGCIAFHVLA